MRTARPLRELNDTEAAYDKARPGPATPSPPTSTREFGVRTANSAVISTISATLAADYAGAKPYSGS